MGKFFEAISLQNAICFISYDDKTRVWGSR